MSHLVEIELKLEAAQKECPHSICFKQSALVTNIYPFQNMKWMCKRENRYEAWREKHSGYRKCHGRRLAPGHLFTRP